MEHISWRSGVHKRKRSADTAYSKPDTGLFVTDQTATPEPERRTIATLFKGRGDIPMDLSSFDDLRDDVDMSDEGDGDESEETYSQEAEPFPDVAAYSPMTAKAVERAQGLVECLVQIFQPYIHSSKEVKTMADKAVQAQARLMTSKQRIMLLGHTGSGKSSTTNSFVDEPDASKAAATGESCTCVPTLITATLDDQHKKYAAEVCLFDEDTRRAFLLEHVKNYITYEFQQDETWSSEEDHEYRLNHETAVKIFRALFCNKSEFASPGSISNHISTRHREDHLQLIDTLEAWCKNLLLETGLTGPRPFLRFDADTARELNAALEPHIFEKGTFDQPAIWPLIEHVRKGINGSRILTYTDFLDLPGTFDTNRVRAEFAHKFVRDSDALWVVTSIERPLSDAHLDRVLSTYAHRFGHNVAIIATRSDASVDNALAKALQEKKQSVGEYWEQSSHIKDLSQQLIAAEKKIKTHQGRKRQRTTSTAEMNSLYASAAQLTTRLQETKNAQMDGLVEVRNSYIMERLKKEKKKHLAPGAELSVFCVSNTHYSAHKGVPSDDARLMSVESTGVPALRTHALRMASVREMNRIEEYLNKILVLLKGAVLWAEATPTQQNIDVMNIGRQPLALLDTLMEDFTETSGDKCDLSLIRPMIKNRSKYESAAVRYKNSLNAAGGWHHSTVRAFFRRGGNHMTKGKAHEAWNERFIDDQTATIEGAWYGLLLRLKEALRSGAHKVVKAVEAIPAQLSSSAAGAPVAMQPLHGFIASCCNRIHTAYDSRMEELDKKMSNLKMDTTRDVPSAYFTEAMRDMYEDCKDMKGQHCTQRMLATLENWLYGKKPQYGGFNSPFAAVTTSLQTDFSETITAVARELHEDMDGILQDMAQHLERSTQRNMSNSKEMAVHVAIRGALQGLKPEIEATEEDLEVVKWQYGVLRE
ncbi:hypothetical protein BST61_g2272 [Cercospora zeina]